MSKLELESKLGWKSKSYNEMTLDECVLITQWYLSKYDTLTKDHLSHLKALCYRLFVLVS